MGLVLLDEVHLLNEVGRGSSLEAGCVCRIKAVAAFPELSKAHIAAVRFVAVSATIPNIGDVSGGCRLHAPVRSCCMQQPWLSSQPLQLAPLTHVPVTPTRSPAGCQCRLLACGSMVTSCAPAS